MKPHEVIGENERISYEEFVKRLQENRLDPTHFGVRLFNDPRLKFEREQPVSGKRQLFVSRAVK